MQVMPLLKPSADEGPATKTAQRRWIAPTLATTLRV